MPHTVAITVRMTDTDPVDAVVEVQELDLAQRGSRAFKGAALLATLGLASHFIAVLSTFGPWLMLILAVSAYVHVHRQATILQACALPCPACGAEVNFAQQSVAWPVKRGCSSCQRQLTLHLKAASPNDKSRHGVAK